MLKQARSFVTRTKFTPKSMRTEISQHRFYSGGVVINTISKEELQELIKNRATEPYFLIDVRNPDELTGDMPLIESAINIPLPDFGSAFMTTDPMRFQTMYGIPKPNHNERIICYCRSGRRSDEGKYAVLLEFLF